MPKSDSIEMQRRVRQVTEWMIDGHTTTDIVATCATRYQVDERQAYNYIKKAREAFKLKDEAEVEEKKGYHIAARMKLYQRLKGKEDPDGAGAALRILQDMAKLDGLYAPKKHEHTGKDGKPIQVESITPQVDYSKLPTEVLQAIVSARINEEA